ncbi:MAG: hypothetical protein JJU15_08165 [Pararhodobacter sp.]|nr:hypothetical protein [Pararhodobacter sp.]
MPKTGTSSIQEFLHLNREILASRGIRYARFDDRLGSQFELAATGRVAAGAAVTDESARLVLRLKAPGDEGTYVARYRDFLDAQLQSWTQDLFVASSEHIQAWLHKRDMIEALDAFLGTRFESVRYVVYLRAQEDLLISSYSERIKRGETLDLEEHLTKRIKAADLNRIVGLWERAVGRDRLDVRLMTPDALVGGDLLTDFCDIMGTARSGLEHPGRINTSLNRDEIFLRLKLNRWLSVRRRRDGEYNPLYFKTLDKLKKLTRCGNEPLVLTPEQRDRITAYHAQSNERLRARRFPERSTLF